MQNESLAEQLKAHWQRVNSPESLALAKGIRASSSAPKVTIRPTLPADGEVVILEEVFDLPMPENSAIDHQPS